MISTASPCRDGMDSTERLGLSSTTEQIRNSGQWQVDARYRNELSSPDLANVRMRCDSWRAAAKVGTARETSRLLIG